MSQFFSSFGEPDSRWQTRHTPTPDLPASDLAYNYRSGQLVMRLKQTDLSSPVHTTHLATLGHSFTFGNFSVRMRFPSPRGAHSCFWLQDVKPDHVGGSEVDVVEHFGSDRTIWNNVYWREEPNNMWPNKPLGWRYPYRAIDPREWHTYSLQWSPHFYRFAVDGVTTDICTEGVSSRPKVMILSLLSSKWEWPNLDREHLFRYKTLVDWVRVTNSRIDRL